MGSVFSKDRFLDLLYWLADEKRSVFESPSTSDAAKPSEEGSPSLENEKDNTYEKKSATPNLEITEPIVENDVKKEDTEVLSSHHQAKEETLNEGIQIATNVQTEQPAGSVESNSVNEPNSSNKADGIGVFSQGKQPVSSINKDQTLDLGNNRNTERTSTNMRKGRRRRNTRYFNPYKSYYNPLEINKMDYNPATPFGKTKPISHNESLPYQDDSEVESKPVGNNDTYGLNSPKPYSKYNTTKEFKERKKYFTKKVSNNKYPDKGKQSTSTFTSRKSNRRHDRNASPYRNIRENNINWKLQDWSQNSSSEKHTDSKTMDSVNPFDAAQIQWLHKLRRPTHLNTNSKPYSLKDFEPPKDVVKEPLQNL